MDHKTHLIQSVQNEPHRDAGRKAANDAKASAGVTTSNIKDITKSIDRLTANAPDDIKSQASINKLYGVSVW